MFADTYFCSRNERVPGARDTGGIGVYRRGEGIYHLEPARFITFAREKSGHFRRAAIPRRPRSTMCPRSGDLGNINKSC